MKPDASSPAATGTVAVPEPLSAERLALAAQQLAAGDAALAGILAAHGTPPLWAREPGFPTLIHIILEQQVSLASAQAAYDRLRAAASPLTPERFLSLDDAALRAFGFSRQKTRYCRDLALAVCEGRLDIAALATMDDDTVRAELMRIKGIGHWSAEIYLLMVLRRPDAWPVGDLALAVALQRVKRLPRRPSPEALREHGEAWRPWRAVAARLLWHHYLS